MGRLQLRRRWRLSQVAWRYLLRAAGQVGQTANTVPGPLVINLDRRSDRREHVVQQFRQLGWDCDIVPGVEDANGALGCALAHKNVLASVSPGENVWVCEDDIAFDVTSIEIEAVVEQFLLNPRLDVLCLSHTTVGPTAPISAHLTLTAGSLTTASYVVKAHAVSALYECFDRSAVMLAMGYPPHIAAIDVQWLTLQRESLVFCVPRRQIAHQTPSFSDVEGRDVDYSRKNTRKT